MQSHLVYYFLLVVAVPCCFGQQTAKSTRGTESLLSQTPQGSCRDLATFLLHLLSWEVIDLQVQESVGKSW